MTGTGFPLRPASQGLVVVDMQNDFVRQGAPQEVTDARAIVPAVQRLLEAFRRGGRPVFFTRFIAGPSRTLMWAFSPECADEMKSCWLGHQRQYGDRANLQEGPAVIDELTPRQGEPVIDKFGYSAFFNTNLADALRANAVEQVVVVGTVTQICVEDTVRNGFHFGLEMVVVEDGVASFDADLHAASLRGMSMKYALVVESEKVLEGLAQVEGR